MNFGSSIVPSVASGTINSYTTISLDCSSGTSFQLALSEGAHATGSLFGAMRRLLGSNGGYLTYGLYQDGGRSITWGDGTNVGTVKTGTGQPTGQMLIYSSLTVPTSAAVGSYSDSVALTVSF